LSKAHPYKIVIPLNSFDRNLLPNPEISQEELPVAIHEYLSTTLIGQGVNARLMVSSDGIRVEWGSTQKDLIELAVQLLTDGKYPEGVLILRGVVAESEPEPSALYNLGMALSDLGELNEAISFLSQYVRSRPEDVDGRIALGVAYARNAEESKAIEVLESTCKEFPNHAFAHRNLGGALLRSDRLDEAVVTFKTAVELDSSDAGSWLGLGQAFAGLAERTEADNAFRKVIEIDPQSAISEVAKTELTQLAEQSLRANGAGATRPDAVMYCLAALERFRDLSDQELIPLFAELATKGQLGFDINNPERSTISII
jgi:tetratricopeptide (TPR) repeat protein